VETLNKESNKMNITTPFFKLRGGVLCLRSHSTYPSTIQNCHIFCKGDSHERIHETESILEQLQNKLNEINGLISEKKRELDSKSQELDEGKKMLDEIISERAELEVILDKCSIDICQYKIAFEEIRTKHSKQINDHITNKKFHFFACYRGDYYSSEKSVIEWHQEVIDKNGFCWWAKFFKQRKNRFPCPFII